MVRTLLPEKMKIKILNWKGFYRHMISWSLSEKDMSLREEHPKDTLTNKHSNGKKIDEKFEQIRRVTSWNLSEKDVAFRRCSGLICWEMSFLEDFYMKILTWKGLGMRFLETLKKRHGFDSLGHPKHTTWLLQCLGWIWWEKVLPEHFQRFFTWNGLDM